MASRGISVRVARWRWRTNTDRGQDIFGKLAGGLSIATWLWITILYDFLSRCRLFQSHWSSTDCGLTEETTRHSFSVALTPISRHLLHSPQSG